MRLKPLILVIEDDLPIRNFLRSGLVNSGFAYEETGTAETGISLIFSLKPDMILLDLGLPDCDGLTVIEQMNRENMDFPIIVISARDQELEKVKALELGAQDYITKPFGLEELKARIKVILKRQNHSEQSNKSSLQFGELKLDFETRRVFLAQTELHLSPLEYRLLLFMAQSPGKILTTTQLLQAVWGKNSLEQKHYVRILMSGLRKKLETDMTRPEFIHTETGIGYRFYN